MLSTTNPFGPIDLVTKAEALWQIGRAHVSSDLIRPSEPSVTHHICVFFKPHSSDVIYNKPVWADRPRDESGSALADRKSTRLFRSNSPDGPLRDPSHLRVLQTALFRCYLQQTRLGRSTS